MEERSKTGKKSRRFKAGNDSVKKSRQWWIGVDIGGTFTDVVVYDPETSSLQTYKTPSVQSDPTRGVLTALGNAGVPLNEVSRLVHGTTIATNTVLEKNGARTALVTTKGFRDVLELAFGNRMILYRLDYRMSPPLIPRQLRLEVDERMLKGGRVLRTVTRKKIDSLLGTFDQNGVEAIAICFLHAYTNPKNEDRARVLLESLLPGVFVTTSAEVVPEWREYERFSTTVLNAYVAPPIGRALKRLEAGLRRGGISVPLQVMNSSGGIMTPGEASRLPVNLLYSGPAGGVTAAAHLSRMTKERNIIAYDMGGTSTDVCLIRNSKPSVTTEGEISGYPNKALQVEIESIGAGGGSIAWVDRGSVLAVGPKSAGADPGPACYGRGGCEATVTDANLLLNRLGAESLQAGGVVLDVGMAREAVRRVGRHFPSLDETKTAEGIIRIAVARMVSAIKTITVRKGHDPREFTLVAYGGAGPMHAPLIADELAIGRILIPPAPGNFSALGLLMADHRTNLVRSRISRSEETPLSVIRSILSELEDEGRRKLFSVLGTSKIAFERWVGMRYLGQWYEIDIPFDPAWRKTRDFIRDFNLLHQEMYGHSEPEEETLVVHYRVSAYAPLPKPVFSTQVKRRMPRPVARREVYFGDGFVQANLFNRHDLGLGAQIHGPAVIEEEGSSTVLPPGWNAKVDQWGILVLKRGGK